MPVVSELLKRECEPRILSKPDYVVHSASNLLIGRDARFRRWRKQRQSIPERKLPVPVPRTRKA